MSQAVLVLNAGSSSLKFTVYQQREEGLRPRYDGQIEGIGTAPHFVVRDAGGATIEDDRWSPEPGRSGQDDALARLSAWLDTDEELMIARHTVAVLGQGMEE